MININSDEIRNFYVNEAAKCPNNEKMKLRIGHIADVARYAGEIANAHTLPERGCQIAILCGWTHDLYQVLQIAGNAPDPHLHHSNPEAVERELFANGRIDTFASGLTDTDKHIIKTAIVQHAKIAINLDEVKPYGGESQDVVLGFCHLLRDADKAAIYELISADPIYVLRNDWKFPDDQIFGSSISPKPLADLMSGKCVNNADIKQPADWVLSQLAYLYDAQSSYALSVMLEKAELYVNNCSFFPDDTLAIIRDCYKRVRNIVII